MDRESEKGLEFSLFGEGIDPGGPIPEGIDYKHDVGSIYSSDDRCQRYFKFVGDEITE